MTIRIPGCILRSTREYLTNREATSVVKDLDKMETWKKIEGFDGFEVSDKGNVRKVKTGRVLSKTVVDGKAKVGLPKQDGKRAFRQVNQLVAEAFKPELVSTTHTINNIDGDPSNNSVENLEAVLRGNNKYANAECSEDGCSTKPLARGLCATHYHLWYKDNATDVKHRNLYEVVGYKAAHRRLDLRRGKASEYTCSCGDKAEQWALLSMDADVLYKQINQRDRNKVYSLNPDDYEPMCRACHMAYDKKAKGHVIQRFGDCVEVSLSQRARTSDHDYDALTEQIKQASSIKEVSAKTGVHAKVLGDIFQMVTGTCYRDWKRQEKGAA